MGHSLKFTITYGEVNWLDLVLVVIKDPSKSPDSAITFRSFTAQGFSFQHTFDSPGPKHFVVTATYQDGTTKTTTLDFLVRSSQDPTKDTYTLTVTTDDARGSVSPATPAEVPTGGNAQISATAKEGFVFDEWKVTAGTAAIDDPRTASTTVTLQSDAIVRAFFVPASSVLCTLTVVTGENGTVIKDPDTTIFNPGDSVRLTARPKAGYYFGGWEGDTISLDSSILVKVTKNFSVRAIFPEEGKVSLTVSAQNGKINRSPDLQSYSKGDTVTLTATPDTGYRFVSWSGTLGSTNPLKIVLNESMQVSATFARLKYRLTLAADTGGTIIAPSPRPDSVEHGVATTITASAATGYAFAGWRVTSGSATIADSTLATTTVTLTSGNATVRAIFSQSAFTLTIPQPTNGTVVQVPANKTTFTHGETVTLTARPDTGYYFGGWGEDTSGTATSITVTMTRNRTISATFTIIGSLTLTTTAVNGAVTKSPDKASYQYGDQVTLTATPNTGYTFSSWGGAASGSVNPVTITMDGSKSVTANFSIKRYALSITSTNGSVSKSVSGTTTTADTFDSNTVVTLTANPIAGYQFSSWSGAVTGTNPTTTVTMNTAKAVTANFSAIRYTITYNLNSGTNSASNPSSYRIDTASITLAPATRNGYTFDGWFDNSNLTGTAVTTIPSGSTGDKVFWAKWKAVYQLSVATSSSIYGTVSGGGTAGAGEPIQIVATPRANCKFVEWKVTNGTAQISTQSATTTATLSSNATVTAYFIIQDTIRLVGGSVNSSNRDGRTWATCYNRVQDALAEVSAGVKEIWVLGGYIDSFTLVPNVKVFGGCKVTEASKGQRPSSALWSNLTNVYDPVTGAESAVIDGFRFSVYAARLYRAALETAYPMTVSNCIFDACTTSALLTSSAGIYTSALNPITVRNVVFQKCLFMGHTSASGGAAFTGKANMYNCLFWNNYGRLNAGACYSLGSRFVNCTWIGNNHDKTFRSRAAINSVGDDTLVNCIMWGNTRGTTELVKTSFEPKPGDLILSSVIDTIADLDPAFVGTYITDSPNFVNISNPLGSDGYPSNDDGLIVISPSPILGTGNSSYAPPTDIRGVVRPIPCDIGTHQH